MVEVGEFCPMGYGPWLSTIKPLFKTIAWQKNPWELVSKSGLEDESPDIGQRITGKSLKVPTGDPVIGAHEIRCGSASDLSSIDDGTHDLVITDPPFGEIMQYAELSDFFYVWLKNPLSQKYPEVFASEYTPKALEAVSNPTRQDDPKEFYQRLLTACWRECNRILKDSGLLAFTFHHSEDEPWIAVLQSLFDAGFYLEAAYPIRSDETKGKGEFGSQLIEFDIIHVCRKRLGEPAPISWARVRQQIIKDVRQLQEIIENHQEKGLGEADLQVIRRGKALEYFSRHYGKVYIQKGREDEFTVKDALVGINQLLNSEDESLNDYPPFSAEPYTRQFLRLFRKKNELPRDQLQKFLRGTGVSPDEFEQRGWCKEQKKVFILTPALEWAMNWKGKSRKSMARDFDQTYFLIGACYANSGINVRETLNSGSFVPHPAIGDLLNWFVLHGADQGNKRCGRQSPLNLQGLGSETRARSRNSKSAVRPGR